MRLHAERVQCEREPRQQRAKDENKTVYEQEAWSSDENVSWSSSSSKGELQHKTRERETVTYSVIGKRDHPNNDTSWPKRVLAKSACIVDRNRLQCGAGARRVQEHFVMPVESNGNTARFCVARIRPRYEKWKRRREEEEGKR